MGFSWKFCKDFLGFVGFLEFLRSFFLRFCGVFSGFLGGFVGFFQGFCEVFLRSRIALQCWEFVWLSLEEFFSI